MTVPLVSPEIPEELVDLGVILGILTPPNGQPSSINTEWFRNPDQEIKGILADPARSQALIDLATGLLGSVTEHLDLPDIDESAETWIPIATTGSGSTVAGVFAIIDTRGADPVVSIGGRVSVTHSSLTGATTLRVPVVSAGSGGIAVLPGSADGDIEVGISVSVDGLGVPGVVELSGVAISALLPTNGDEPSLTVVLEDLLLPGDTSASDVPLGELLDEIGPTAIQMLIGLLRSQTTLPSEVEDLLALIGFDPASPIPELPIADLITDGYAALRAWLQQVVAEALDEWMARLASFLDVAAGVDGAGTTVDPYKICIDDAATHVCLTLATATDQATAATTVIPGASLTIDAPGTSPVGGSVAGSIEFCRLLLDQSLTVSSGPSLRAFGQLGTGSLVSTTVDTFAVEVGSLRAGLAFATDSGLVPIVDAVDVKIGTDEYAVLDLTSADAVTGAAANALDDIIATLLADLGITTNPEAKALAVLAGLVPPDTAPAGWPATVNLPAFFSDPLGAIGCYHVDVLSVPGQWQHIAEHLAFLLRSADAVPATVSGTGTATDPWAATLFDNITSGDAARGSVDLVAWSSDQAGAPRLHLGLRSSPIVDVSGLDVGIAYTGELLRIDLPAAASCPAPIDLTWAPTHSLAVTARAIDVDVDAVRFTADSATAGLELDRQTGIQPSFALANPQLTIDGTDFALPDFSLGDLPDLDDIPWPAIQLLIGDWLGSIDVDLLGQLAALFGWRPGDPLDFTFPQLPDLDLDLPDLPALDLGNLISNPFGAILDWLKGLFGGGGGGLEFPGFLIALGRWAAALGGDIAGLVSITGAGTYEDPWAVRIGDAPVEALFWIDPDGPNLGGVAGIVNHLVPLDVLDNDPSVDDLVVLLQSAANVVPGFADRLGDATAFSNALTALSTRFEGDGLVSAADQVPAGWDRIDLSLVAHFTEPASFEMPDDAAGIDEQHRIFVTNAAIAGTSPWPGEDTATVIDLTEPGIRPESIDLSAVTAGSSWVVRLPSRADAVVPDESGVAGEERLKQRLRRAVDHIHGIVGGDLALIGHSTAGQIARLVGSDPSSETHVTDVVTIGTPHLGAGLEFLDRSDTGEALRTLQRLRAMLDDAVATAPDVAPITNLIDTITKTLDPYIKTAEGALEYHGLPVDDFLVPANYPDLDAGTTGHAIVGAIAPDLDEAMATFLRRILEAAVGLLPGSGTMTHLGIGLRSQLMVPETTPGALAVDLSTRVDLHQVEIAAGATERPIPRVTLDLTLGRNGGWLVGGPDPAHPASAPRDPRARWMEATMAADPTNLDDTSVRIVVHDASVFGTQRDEWIIDDGALGGGLDGDTLLPEARVILGEIANGLGTLAAGTPIELLAQLLAALGLAEIVDERLGFVTDAVERLLADPAGEIASRLASHSSDVVAAVADAIPLQTDADGHHIEISPGFAIDLPNPASGGPRRIELSLVDLPIAEFLRVAGAFAVDDTGTVSADVRIGTAEPVGPLGSAEVRVTASTATASKVELVIADNGQLPKLFDAPIPIPPTGDDLSRGVELAAQTIAGELLRRLLEFASDAMSTARQDALNLLLDGAGLLRSDGRVRNIVGLVAKPQEWLSVPNVLGLVDSLPATTAGTARLSATKVRSLVLAAGDILELPTNESTLSLPWDVSIEIGGNDGTVDLSIGWDAPVGSSAVDIEGDLTVSIAPGFDVGATIDASIAVEGTGLDHARLDVSVGTDVALAVAIQPTGSPELVITLLPEIGGLADLSAGGVAQAILPLALDAIATQPDIGAAFASLGDNLGLRDASGFLSNQLQLLAANPAAELAARLHAAAGPIIADLGGLLGDVSSGVIVSGTKLTITPVPNVSLSLDLPTLSDIELCVDIAEYRPAPGLRLDISVCVDPTGLESFSFSAEIDDPALLEAAGVSFMPRVAVLLGTAAGSGGDRAEAGLWVDGPAADPRHGVFVLMPFGGSPDVKCRTQTAANTTDSDDLGACLTAIVGEWVTPLAAELVLATADVTAYLDTALTNFPVSLGTLLSDATILAKDGADWHLADGLVANLFDRMINLAVQVADKITAAIPLDPVELSLSAQDDSGRKRFGVTVGLASPIALNPGDDIEISLTEPAGSDGGVTVFVFSTDAAFGDVQFDPSVSVDDVGIRIASGAGDKLIDSVAGLSAIELLGSFEIGAGPPSGGIELGLIDLTFPIGAAGGGNPVASKILSQQNEDGESGDNEELAPSLNPRLELTLAPDFELDFRLDVGPGPWWIPIQQAFGPIYVEQIGGDTETDSSGDLAAVMILLDGGVSLAGLNVGVDDLSLRIPVVDAWDLSQWSIDLQGLAVGYSGSGVTLAGGLRKSETDAGIEYIGLVQVDAMSFGLSAVGAYGEFADPAAPGTTYTSMFVFAVLSAPLGGPPFFFVTGIGGGIGLNRELVLPADVVDIPGFPLVAAMDSSSGFATDPMGALRDVSTSFPGKRGTFWFAAGVRFTSFVLIETVAVLAVEVGDDVEVALLGLSRATLPDPAFPIANIELALIARFSTAEGVLWVQAQLTDNSWLLNEDCRLTGGFAFVVWFKKDEFVFTIGGYHPRFATPEYYPSVPRLGFNWNVSGAIVIKGENYFALTSSCVMAGAAIEVSYTTSVVWASLSAGIDGLVSWDPFFYDVEAYIRVSAGIKIRVCFFVCATIKLSFSLGARLRIWGPELKGSATLELGPIEVTVTFGANPEDERKSIPWSTFVEKYLVQDNPAGESMSMTAMKGLLAPDPGVDSDPDDGTAAKPWRLVPEFTIGFETRAASKTVTYPGSSISRMVTVDLGPVAVTNVNSEFKITVTEIGNGDVTSGLELVAPVLAKLPDGPWRYVARESRGPEAGSIEALTGVVLKAELRFEDGDIVVDLALTDPSEKDHPLPFIAEQQQRPDFAIHVTKSNEFLAAMPTEARLALTTAATAIDDLPTASIRTFRGDRVSPPRLAPLTEGMVDNIKDPVATEPTLPPEPPPTPDTSTHAPIVMGVLRSELSGQPDAPTATTVKASADVLRLTAPTLASVQIPGGAFPRARLEVGSAAVTASRGTVVPRDHVAATRTSVAGREFVGGFASSRNVAAKLRLMERRLRNGGHELSPGDVMLLKLPNAYHDSRQQRPSLAVEGDQLTRIVVLDRAGAPLEEQFVTEGLVDLPIGAERIALNGLGTPRRGSRKRAGAGLAGWHAESTLHQVASNTYLANEAIVRSAAARTRRKGSAVSVANLTGRKAVAGRSVTTHLPQDTSVLVVGLAPTEPVTDPADAFSSVSLGLFGADRRKGPDGSVLAPRIVVAGEQVYGVFAIEANTKGGDWVTVSIESDRRWNVVAVGGTTGRPESLIDDLRDGPPARLFTRGANPAGASKVRFLAAELRPDKPRKKARV